MKNRISLKLSLYFGITLLIFTLIIGGLFFFLFRSQTVKIHRDEMEKQAVSIADALRSYVEADTAGRGPGYSAGSGGYGAVLRLLPELAGADVWVVDENLEMLTAGRGGAVGKYNYNDLPKDAESIITEAFTDKIVFSQDFSAVLAQQTLTVGAPIKHSGRVAGVVLLHSPVTGIDQAVKNATGILAVSIVLGLVLSLLLSLRLSKHFTDPILIKQAEEVIKNEKLRRDFVSNISHELKTPVTVLRCSLDAINDNVAERPEQIKEYNRAMQGEVRHLERLVGDLLDLSRLQSPDFNIDKSEISLCDLAEDAARSLSRIAQVKNITINVNKENAPCLFYGDYGRLRQMLMIVLDNAIKFSDSGKRVDVTIDNKKITVRDYGAGIPREDMAHIFDRFYKSRDERNKQGTGLGLAIAKEIADRHNIGIRVSSDKNGTEFVFKMP